MICCLFINFIGRMEEVVLPNRGIKTVLIDRTSLNLSYKIVLMGEPKDPFFKEVTSTICSSVEISTWLHRALLLLNQRMALDMMIIGVYDEALGGLWKIAMATEKGGRDSNKIMRLPPSTRERERSCCARTSRIPW